VENTKKGDLDTSIAHCSRNFTMIGVNRKKYPKIWVAPDVAMCSIDAIIIRGTAFR
jgi:hypothetical protein